MEVEEPPIVSNIMLQTRFERDMVFCSYCRSLQSGRVAITKYIITALASVIFFISSSSYAAEPWADPKLPVHDGLEFWLDATRATGDRRLPADGKLNKWRDASGKNRNLKPPDASAQPSLLKIGNAAIVRFDGIDDHLRAVKLGAKLDSFTVVLVAAPRQQHGRFRRFHGAQCGKRARLHEWTERRPWTGCDRAVLCA